ncbi:MAG TPA: NUDIX hydrolase [Rhizomicrobium sp.]|nr:NUDIX hydrolase [Rhizomicrobium sp.]
MRGEALFREHGKQVAALCWRLSPKRGSQLEVLLITSLNSKRWIMPKGWPEPDLSGSENAAREAFEEAGVTGKISPQPVGTYHYLKERKDGGGVPCRVEVFVLAVTKQSDDWPEKGVRELAWVPVDQAVTRIAEPGLRQVLKEFRKQHVPQKARRAG